MGRLKEQSLDPETKIRYTIDLTRGYHNLLQKEETGSTQTYLWDGNVAGMKEEAGNNCYCFQDELGSPVRLMDEEGSLRETYGYDEFGQDLYGNQGVAQPFGYTGYQSDRITGTCYAQAREYRAELGRFAGRDIIKGYTAAPYTLNEYGYCWGNPMVLVDQNGAWPKWMEDAGESIKDGWNNFCDDVSYVWNNYIYGEDITNVKIEMNPVDNWYGIYEETVITETTHQGGSIIVRQRTGGVVVSDGYSIGIPKILNIGITVGTDGINISRFLGVENVFETHGNINIGSSSIVELDSKLKIGWDGNVIGYGSSFGVSPVSQVKIYGISETVNDNGENIYNEIGGYVRTGIVYAFLVTVALLYGVISTAGTMTKVLIPIYTYIMELLGISVETLNKCGL